jgi:hypothetical protein
MLQTIIRGRRSVEVNLELLRRVATRIGKLRDHVMFLGGAVLPLLVPEPLAADIRVAKDIDLMVHAETKADLWAFEDQLWDSGLKRVTTSAASKWRVEDLHVDVLTTEPDTVDFINHWGREAVREKQTRDIGGGLVINVIRSTHYLATKIDAFYRRGYGNHQASTDIYDILLMLRGCPDLDTDFRRHTSPALQAHLATELSAIASAASAWRQQVTAAPRFDAFDRQWRPEAFERMRRLFAATGHGSVAATV